LTVKRVMSKKDLKICKFFTGFYKFYITLALSISSPAGKTII